MAVSVKARKAAIFKWLNTESDEWEVLISRKSLELGDAHYAEVDLEDKTIMINPYKTVNDFVASLVHEILHILNPRSYEKTILRWEAEIIHDMSPSEKTALLTLVFSKGMVQWDE